MKRIFILLLVFLGPLVSRAGVEHHESHKHTYLPQWVMVSLGNHYHHFDLIHSRSVYSRGRVSFDVVLQYRNAFINVSVGPGGHFYGESRYDHYPLANHYCDDYCTFHYQHYEHGRYVSYDPYYGCNNHISLIVRSYPRYIYRPFYGYGNMYYHPGYGHYKRFKHYHHGHHHGYHAYKKPKYYKHGYRHGHGHGNGHGYGHYKGHKKYRDSGHYRHKGNYRHGDHRYHGERRYREDHHSHKGKGHHKGYKSSRKYDDDDDDRRFRHRRSGERHDGRRRYAMRHDD